MDEALTKNHDEPKRKEVRQLVIAAAGGTNVPHLTEQTGNLLYNKMNTSRLCKKNQGFAKYCETLHSMCETPIRVSSKLQIFEQLKML
jgi:hypothetical protein